VIKVLLVGEEGWGRDIVRTFGSWNGTGMEIAGVAKDSQEALRLINRFSPQIIITDIHRPGMDSGMLLNHLHHHSRQVKVIVISRFDDFRFAQNAIRFGAVDYLLMPVNPQELNVVLQRCSKELEAASGKPDASFSDQELSRTLSVYKEQLRIHFNELNKDGVISDLQGMRRELELGRAAKPGNIRQVAQEMVLLLRDIIKSNALEDRTLNVPIDADDLHSLENITAFLIKLYCESLKQLNRDRGRYLLC